VKLKTKKVARMTEWEPPAQRAFQQAAARKLVKIIRTTEDVAVKVMARERLRLLPVEVAQDAMNEAPRQGRSQDLMAEYQKRLETDPSAKPPLIVKVAIAGSGDDAWRTHVDFDGLLVNEDLKKQPSGNVVHYKKKELELNFAGPGAGNTTGVLAKASATTSDALGRPDKRSFGGTSDTGSNSIAELVKHVPALVKKEIEAGLGNEKRPVVILVKGHSRGGVAATRVADILKQNHPDATVELTAVDPVPGPGHKGDNVSFTLSKDEQGDTSVDESTVVYSVASGHYAGFTPQKVFGATRIILSRQDHGVGLLNGFYFQGKLYKGHSLNSLPAGVYIDNNANGRNNVELVSVGSFDDALTAFDDAYEVSEATIGDYWLGRTRSGNVKRVLAEYFEVEPGRWPTFWEVATEFFMQMHQG
jgi:hypothetical protein